MINGIALAAAYLFIALGLEHGVFPMLSGLAGGLNWSDIRLVALGVIMLGCTRGELEAMVFGLGAALFAGAAAGPGYMGPTLLSFTVAAFVSARVVRWFFFERFLVRLVVLYALILGERWFWAWIHDVLWGTASPGLALWTHLLVAIGAAATYIPLRRSLNRPISAPRTVARRKRSQR